MRWKKIIDQARKKGNAIREFWESPAILTPYKENISENEKIAGLSKLWSEVKYNFVNFDLVPDVKWDALFVGFIPRVRKTNSTFEYYKVLTELIAKLRDGHSNVYMPDELRDQVYSRPPMRADLIEGKVIVTETFSDEISQKGIEIGNEILTIDGVSAKEYGERYVMPYQSASTRQDLIKRTYNYFLFAGEKGKPIKLTLADNNGKRFDAEIQRYSNQELQKLRNDGAGTAFEFKVLPN
ncbi:MAG: hypothetical protein KDB79_16350, partial [Acidobacteria bacterium]|nr:hypothetical protein [Acidobacteriota bacterium]